MMEWHNLGKHRDEMGVIVWVVVQIKDIEAESSSPLESEMKWRRESVLEWRGEGIVAGGLWGEGIVVGGSPLPLRWEERGDN